MHECVFTDKNQASTKVITLDIAKRLMDYGFHPPTIYFPLVVSGATMIEPTETECRTDLDAFIAAMKSIAEEANSNPELLNNSPRYAKLRRLDETGCGSKSLFDRLRCYAEYKSEYQLAIILKTN
jgi:glycine dehydrogenase subunit 2